MKNTLRIDHDARTIVMDRTFAKYAENTMSDEYAHLQRVRKDYPNYDVVQRTIRRNANKKTYYSCARLTLNAVQEDINEIAELAMQICKPE